MVRNSSTVTFPSGDTATLSGNSNICMTCHQGRNSTVQVQVAIDGADTHSFINIHYYPAAATFFGADVQGGYEYPAKTYSGPVSWPAAHSGPGFNTCIGCHMGSDADHTFLPELQDCAPCHGSPPAGWKSGPSTRRVASSRRIAMPAATNFAS